MGVAINDGFKLPLAHFFTAAINGQGNLNKFVFGLVIFWYLVSKILNLTQKTLRLYISKGLLCWENAKIASNTMNSKIIVVFNLSPNEHVSC